MRDEQAALGRRGFLQEGAALGAWDSSTATVAHELRNPLSAIRNSLHALRELTEDAGLPLERAMSGSSAASSAATASSPISSNMRACAR